MRLIQLFSTILLFNIIECQKKLSCPKEYEFDGENCVKSIITKAEVKCPPNYVLKYSDKNNDAECVQFFTEQPIQNCPKDYQLVNGICVKKSIQSPLYLCPPGTQNSKLNNYCIATTRDVQFDCPYSFTLELINNTYQCSKTIRTGTTSVCPPGFRSFGTSHCIIESHSDPIINCPNNSTYDNKTNACIKQIVLQPTFTCPTNTNFNGTTCVINEDPTPTPDDNTTTSSTTNASNNDIVFSSSNNQPQYCKPKAYCPTGYTLQNNVCEIFEQIDPVCPNGYTYNKTIHKCEFRNTMDPKQTLCPSNIYQAPITSTTTTVAITTYAAYECPKDTFMGVVEGNNVCKKCPRNYRQDIRTDKKNNPIDVCVLDERLDINLACDSDSYYDSITKQCIHITTSDPIEVCPEGYTVDHGSCVLESIVPPYELCPPDFVFIDGSCVKEPALSCTNGHQLVDNQCVLLVSANIEISCSSGLRYNASTNKCENTDRITPNKICPDGYLPNGGDINTCVRFETYSDKEENILTEDINKLIPIK